MSGLFGGGAGNIKAPAPLTALRVQTSAYGLPIPIIYGKARISGNLIWYGDFAKHEQQQSGGKGGGGGMSSYTYTASVLLSICEGGIQAINNVWQDKDKKTLAAAGYTAFLGTTPQSPWGYLVTKHGAKAAAPATPGTPETTTVDLNGDTVIVPATEATPAQAAQPTQALAYAGNALVAKADADLGGDASMPMDSFEVAGLLPFSADIPDASMAAVLQDVLTNSKHGLHFPAEWLGDLTSYADACAAHGLFYSPILNEARPAREYITDWLKSSNAEAVWSDGKLKIVSYFDEPATGNGHAFTPNIAPVADLTDDDFLEDSGDPVKITRVANVDAYNAVRVEFLNRATDYATDIAEAKDQAAIERNGYRPADTVTAHEICDASVAARMAQVLLQRMQVVRNTYKFTLGMRHMLLEPMDIVTITDVGLGLYQHPVRITSLSSDGEDRIDIEAEDFVAGAAAARSYPVQLNSGYTLSRSMSPGPLNIPVLFEPPLSYLVDALEVWMGVSGASAAWGGCEVWASYDNATYSKVGDITKAAGQGILSQHLPVGADPDTVNTLKINVAGSRVTFETVPPEYADTLASLLWVNGEMIAYRDATLTGVDSYSLNYLRRGGKGSFISSHLAGSQFVRIDDAIFKLKIPGERAGTRIWFKFRSHNILGGGWQDLAAVTAYPYDIAGLTALAPTAPTVTMRYENGVVTRFSWTPADSSVTTEYIVRYRMTLTAEGGVPADGDWRYLPAINHVAYADLRGLIHGATYEFAVAGRAGNPQWGGGTSAYVSIVRQVKFVTALRAPVGAKLWAKTDGDGNLTGARVAMRFDTTAAEPVRPTFAVIMYSVSPDENAIVVSGGVGATLGIAQAAQIVNQGIHPILVGSTAGRIVVTAASQPLTKGITDFGRFWGWHGASQLRKWTGYDDTGLLFEPPFDTAPTVGGTLNWVQLAWWDDRGNDYSGEFKLGILNNGAAYEIVRWNAVAQNGSSFSLPGVERGAEGTAVINADGIKLAYFPAPGPGTALVQVPMAAFAESNGQFIADTNLDVTIKASQYSSWSCCTYTIVEGVVIRSPIVPLTFEGYLS